MKTHLFLLLLCVLFLFSTCKKEESENCSPTSEIPGTLDSLGLPPATTTGANTMGCLINGEPWLPLKRNIFGDLRYDISFTVGSQSMGGGVSIQGRQDYDELESTIFLYTDPALTEGIYPFTNENDRYINHNNDCGAYDVDTTYNNIIEITRIDFDEEIVSGGFKMRLINDECDTLLVTNGRFDLST